MIHFIWAAFPLVLLVGFLLWMGSVIVSYLYIRDDLYPKIRKGGWEESIIFYTCLLTGPVAFIILLVTYLVRSHLISLTLR
jgi:hypothetical protein